MDGLRVLNKSLICTILMKENKRSNRQGFTYTGAYMQNSVMRKKIASLHEEMDALLRKGDMEAYIQISKKMEAMWIGYLNKDAGLRYLYTFINIWRLEAMKGEHSILNGIKSIEELLQKYRVIRFALRRLENDLPQELCLEGVQWIAEMQLSNTAFRYLLPGTVEDEKKVIEYMQMISETTED